MNLYEQDVINEVLEENLEQGLEVTDNEIATSIMKRLKYVRRKYIYSRKRNTKD